MRLFRAFVQLFVLLGVRLRKCIFCGSFYFPRRLEALQKFWRKNLLFKMNSVDFYWWLDLIDQLSYVIQNCKKFILEKILKIVLILKHPQSSIASLFFVVKVFRVPFIWTRTSLASSFSFKVFGINHSRSGEDDSGTGLIEPLHGEFCLYFSQC